MSVVPIQGLAVDVDEIRGAIGGVPRGAHEAAHVDLLSAPLFTRRPGVQHERPAAQGARARHSAAAAPAIGLA